MFTAHGDTLWRASGSPVLLGLWAALLFGGFAFGRENTERTGRMPLWTRLASSAVLVLAAWSGYAVSRGTTTSLFALLIAIGMTLGLFGDLLMARLLAVAQYMLLGMGAFGLGHVAYIAAGLVYGNQHGLAEAGPRYSVWAIWLVAGLIRVVLCRVPGPAKAFGAALGGATLRASARQHRRGRDRPCHPGSRALADGGRSGPLPGQ